MMNVNPWRAFHSWQASRREPQSGGSGAAGAATQMSPVPCAEPRPRHHASTLPTLLRFMRRRGGASPPASLEMARRNVPAPVPPGRAGQGAPADPGAVQESVAADRAPLSSTSGATPAASGEIAGSADGAENAGSVKSGKSVKSRKSGKSASSARRAGSELNPQPAVSLGPREGQGPVVARDGNIDQENLRRFLLQLVEQLPEIGQGLGLQARRHRDTLQQGLMQLLPDDDSTAPRGAQWMLQLRDGMAAASGTAGALAAVLRRSGARGQAHQLALAYDCLAAFLNELKRIHLTTAAPAVIREYVEREAASLRARLPALGVYSNSQAVSETGVGLGVELSGGEAQASAARNRIILLDDDRDMNFWNAGVATLGGGAGLASLLRAGGSAGGEAGSVYFETETLEDLLALIVNHDANRAWVSSAGQRIRSARSRWQRAASAIGRNMGGQLHVRHPGPPHYLSDRKLAKGFGPAALHLLAAELDHLTGTQAFAVLAERSYPAPAERLRQPDAVAEFREPLSVAVPVSDPLGDSSAPYRNYMASGSFALAASRELGPGADALASLSASLRWNTAQFHLRNVEPAHRLLDPWYHADMVQTLTLHAQVDALLETAPAAKFSAYRQMREALQHSARDDDANRISEADQDYYGRVETIPPQFRGSIATGSLSVLLQRLQAIEDACVRLHEQYIDFAGHAAVLAARRGRSMPPAVLARLEERRREAAEAIERNAWGAQNADAGAGYPGGAQAALKDPSAFIARTHDAIGMALACAGTHLAIVKRRIVQLASLPQNRGQQAELRDLMQQADNRYANVRGLLDKTFLPLKREQVYLARSSFQDKGLSQRHNLTARVSGSGGTALSFGAALAKRLHEPAAEFDIVNDVGQVALHAQCRLQYADYQINPSRQGVFLEFRFAAQAGQPVTAGLLTDAMMRALKKFHPETDEMRQRTSLLVQVQGLAWEVSAEAGVVIRLRKFPGAANFDLQFVRVVETQRSGPRARVRIPLGDGMFSVGWHKQDLMQSVLEEVLGPDIGYLVLQHGKLKEILRAAAAAGGDENAALFALLHGSMRADDMHGRQVARSYLGNAGMIPAVIDRYQEYRESPEPALDAGGRNDRTQNEFHRYFARATPAEPMRRVAAYSREARHFAPGALAAGAGTAADPFAVPRPAATTLLPPALAEGASWAEEKSHIASLASLDERIAYYCSERGRPVLDTFACIISVTKEVHNASRHRIAETRYGFRTQLANRKERRAAESALLSSR